jgi:hypothetical protein
MNGLVRSILALCIAALFSTSLHMTHAQTKDFASRDADIFLTAAYLFPSDNIAADDYGITLHQDGMLFGRLGADFFLIPKLSMGVYMNVGSIKISGMGPFVGNSPSVTMMEFGGSLKGRFIIAHGAVAIKAGVNIGYRMFTSDLKYADKVNAFAIGPDVEVQFATGSVVAPHLEIGFLSQPAGGNNDYTSITFPPIVYIGGGCSLGL